MSTTTFLQLDYSATYGDQPSGYSAAWYLNTYNDETPDNTFVKVLDLGIVEIPEDATDNRVYLAAAADKTVEQAMAAAAKSLAERGCYEIGFSGYRGQLEIPDSTFRLLDVEFVEPNTTAAAFLEANKIRTWTDIAEAIFGYTADATTEAIVEDMLLNWTFDGDLIPPRAELIDTLTALRSAPAPVAQPITFVYLREDGAGFLALQACTVDDDHVWACVLPVYYEWSKDSNLADDTRAILDGSHTEYEWYVIDETTARNFGKIVATWEAGTTEPDIESNLGRSATDALQNAGYEVPEFA